MSTTDTPNKPKKGSPAKLKEPGGYLSSLAGGKSPISMPPIPSWMLNTPMYSKLPMIPAPKGKITLYTTGLGEKLYPTPSELEFDPSAEGLISEYKSLHDPHLKSHYTQPATFHGLIQKKFITPEGKVICTLKEFNEYHQYLKRVHIEKLAQDRKTVAKREREDRERQRHEWSNKEELSPHDKQVLETQMCKRKMLKEQHRRLSQRLEEDAVRQMRLQEDIQTKRSIEKARSSLEREKRRNKKVRMELEEHINRATKRVTLADDETRHAEMLRCYRMSVKERRQLKLEDQWDCHQKTREKHRLEGAKMQKKLKCSIAHNINAREQSVSTRWNQQQSTFESIRDTRAIRIQAKEAKIQARLEKKLKAVRKLFEQRRRKPVGGRRRKPPRHGLGGPRHYSTWPVEYALDRIELSPADGVWKVVDSFLPVSSPVPSPDAFNEPTVIIEPKDRLPSVPIKSRDIFEKIVEDEPATEIQEDRGSSLSSLELAVLFGDHYNSFIASARDLVGNVLHALEAEKRSIDDTSKEPKAVGSDVTTLQETKLPEVMRRASVLQLTNSTVARLVLSKVFCRAREQISAEGGLPQIPSTTPTRVVASNTVAFVGTKQTSITQQSSLQEMHATSPVAKSGIMSDGFITEPEKGSSPQHTTSSSLLAAALVSDVLRNVTTELEQEAKRSDTSILAEDVVWDTIRNVTRQLQKELSDNVTRELEQESQRSDTSILAEDVVRDAIRNVTSQLQKELTDSGTGLIAERVVTDAIRNAAQILRELPLGHSSTSLMAEELASNAIRDATRQLEMLLPQSSSSIIAEAIAADAMNNVMRQLGAQPPQTSSSILAQAFAADALKNATRRLEKEQILHALHPPAHSSSSLLAQAITNDTLQKVTRQVQLEREAMQLHSNSSLLAQAVTTDALENAVRQLEMSVPLPHTDSSLLAQVVTREALQNAALQLQIGKHLQAPHTTSSMLAQEITIDALQNAAAQLTTGITLPHKTSSSRLAQVTVDDALQTAKEQPKTERASRRCLSRGSRSSSPFSPELAKSAVNQTSPEPTQTKARAVASDIIKRATPGMESPSPTKDFKTPTPSPENVVASVSSGLMFERDDPVKKESDDLSGQAQIVVMDVVEGALASLNPDKDGKAFESDEINDENSVDVHRSSILLATVNDVFRESETDISHHQHHSSASIESDESDSEGEPEEQDEIIGVVENEIIAEEESVHSLSECLEGSHVEGLTSVVKKSHDKTIFEGAVIPHDKTHESVTERVLSIEELHKDKSGHLIHDAGSKSSHKVSEGGEYSQDISTDARYHYTTIVPIYHSHLLHLEEEIIAHNLSAISMKPDYQHKVPSAYSASSRNSFRNMFRPDMTHCQGSAKCLKDTLVKELSHPHHEEHSHLYGVLDQPHEDIAAHHSDEELVQQEEVGGVCYLPKRNIYKAHDVLDDVVTEEQERVESEDEATIPESSQDSKDIPAGGDFKSPTEEDVEPTLPVPRFSNKSLRSGKSRDIQSLHSRTASQEKSSTSSSPNGPSKVVSSVKSKSTTETNASSQAASSRSVIAAVIGRISSIFSRKHSTKIFPGATDKQDSDATSKRKESRDQTSSEGDSGSRGDDSIKPDENFNLKDDPTSNSKLGDSKEAAVSPGNGATALIGIDAKETQKIENNIEKDTEVKPQTENNVEKLKVEMIFKHDLSEVKQLEENEAPVSKQVSNQREKQESPADAPRADSIQHIEAHEAERKIEQNEEPEAKNEPIKCAEEQIHTKGQPQLDVEKLQTSGAQINENPNAIQDKTSFDGENKQGDGKILKSGSDSILKGITSSNIGTPKPSASLSTTMSKPDKASSGASSGRYYSKPSKSASPKPRGSTSSAHPSTKTQPGQIKLSAHSFQQQAPRTVKSNSLSKSPKGPSMSNLAKRRSQVSKPPSSGSVRLIKVSPAPSMSSARRRSGKLSSSSVGKLIPGKVSGGSVRLINVSPAASTAIGHRRSSRISEPRSKASVSSCSNPASNKGQKFPTEKSLSRQASCGSIKSNGQKKLGRTVESTLCQKEDEARTPPVLQATQVASSTGSSVVIDTPTESPTVEEPLVTNETPGFLELSSKPQESGEQEHQDAAQELAPVKSPYPHGSYEGTKLDPGEEQQQKHPHSSDETAESSKLVQACESMDMQLQQSKVSQAQVKKEFPAPGGGDQSEDPVPPQDEKAEHEPTQSVSDSSGSQWPTTGRRSKSVISAVIERLSRMFSGEVRASRTSIDGRHQSESKMGAMSKETMQRGDGGAIQQSQSTGDVLFPKASSDGQGSKVGTQLKQGKSTKRVVRGASTSGGSSKSNTCDSNPALAVPTNSAASDSSALVPNVPLGAITSITTTLSGIPSQSTSRTKQDPGSNNLPPVEDVESSSQTPSIPGQLASSKDILDKVHHSAPAPGEKGAHGQ